jgi:hypothetical protein
MIISIRLSSFVTVDNWLALVDNVFVVIVDCSCRRRSKSVQMWNGYAIESKHSHTIDESSLLSPKSGCGCCCLPSFDVVQFNCRQCSFGWLKQQWQLKIL